jgi:hypothetical protein
MRLAMLKYALLMIEAAPEGPTPSKHGRSMISGGEIRMGGKLVGRCEFYLHAFTDGGATVEEVELAIRMGIERLEAES